LGTTWLRQVVDTKLSGTFKITDNDNSLVSELFQRVSLAEALFSFPVAAEATPV